MSINGNDKSKNELISRVRRLSEIQHFSLSRVVNHQLNFCFHTECNRITSYELIRTILTKHNVFISFDLFPDVRNKNQKVSL